MWKGRYCGDGLAFKEDCPGLRNTRVIDIFRELNGNNANVGVYDSSVSPLEAEHEHCIVPTQDFQQGAYDAVIIAVG